jgi:serine-protein kinase ATM
MQLVKGQDDLRQDTVMQQFFLLVNRLLAADASTARRGLHIACYKVIAFSPHAGVLEWVENTMSIGEFLVGDPAKPGAHVRYQRPGDFGVNEVAQLMTKLQLNKSSTLAEWEDTFRRVLPRFPPVMRHFFTERYHEPSLW